MKCDLSDMDKDDEKLREEAYRIAGDAYMAENARPAQSFFNRVSGCQTFGGGPSTLFGRYAALVYLFDGSLSARIIRDGVTYRTERLFEAMKTLRDVPDADKSERDEVVELATKELLRQVRPYFIEAQRKAELTDGGGYKPVSSVDRLTLKNVMREGSMNGKIGNLGPWSEPSMKEFIILNACAKLTARRVERAPAPQL